MDKIKLGTLDKLITNFKKFRPAATENNIVLIKGTGEFIMTNKIPMNVTYGNAVIKHPIMDIIPLGKYLVLDLHMIRDILSLGKTLLADVTLTNESIDIDIEHIGHYSIKLVDEVYTENGYLPLRKMHLTAALFKGIRGAKINEAVLGDDFKNIFNSSKFSFEFNIEGYHVMLHKKLFTTTVTKLKPTDNVIVELFESSIANTFIAFYTIKEKNCTTHIPMLHTSSLKN